MKSCIKNNSLCELKDILCHKNIQKHKDHIHLYNETYDINTQTGLSMVYNSMGETTTSFNFLRNWVNGGQFRAGIKAGRQYVSLSNSTGYPVNYMINSIDPTGVSSILSGTTVDMSTIYTLTTDNLNIVLMDLDIQFTNNIIFITGNISYSVYPSTLQLVFEEYSIIDINSDYYDNGIIIDNTLYNGNTVVIIDPTFINGTFDANIMFNGGTVNIRNGTGYTIRYSINVINTSGVSTMYTGNMTGGSIPGISGVTGLTGESVTLYFNPVYLDGTNIIQYLVVTGNAVLSNTSIVTTNGYLPIVETNAPIISLDVASIGQHYIIDNSALGVPTILSLSDISVYSDISAIYSINTGPYDLQFRNSLTQDVFLWVYNVNGTLMQQQVLDGGNLTTLYSTVNGVVNVYVGTYLNGVRVIFTYAPVGYNSPSNIISDEKRFLVTSALNGSFLDIINTTNTANTVIELDSSLSIGTTTLTVEFVANISTYILYNNTGNALTINIPSLGPIVVLTQGSSMNLNNISNATGTLTFSGGPLNLSLTGTLLLIANQTSNSSVLNLGVYSQLSNINIYNNDDYNVLVETPSMALAVSSKIYTMVTDAVYSLTIVNKTGYVMQLSLDSMPPEQIAINGSFDIPDSAYNNLVLDPPVAGVVQATLTQI